MEKRFKEISHSLVKEGKFVSEWILHMGALCMEANEILSEANKGNESKFNELAKKCVEIGLASDVVAYEMYLANQITLEELNKKKEEIIKNM